MVLALKRRCRNAVDRRSRRRNFDRRCEVNFIPLVTGGSADVDDDVEQGPQGGGGRRRRGGGGSRRSSHDGDRRSRQLLTCHDNIAGFSRSCPSRQPHNDTSHLLCNPVRENARRCETTHAALRGRQSTVSPIKQLGYVQKQLCNVKEHKIQKQYSQ